jgi:hypothetical protein
VQKHEKYQEPTVTWHYWNNNIDIHVRSQFLQHCIGERFSQFKTSFVDGDVVNDGIWTGEINCVSSKSTIFKDARCEFTRRRALLDCDGRLCHNDCLARLDVFEVGESECIERHTFRSNHVVLDSIDCPFSVYERSDALSQQSVPLGSLNPMIPYPATIVTHA